jgi:hypothetical protein
MELSAAGGLATGELAAAGGADHCGGVASVGSVGPVMELSYS